MNDVTVRVGVTETLRNGAVQDGRREVRFVGETLGARTVYGLDRHDRLTDTRGVTETLYRAADGRLVVHSQEWSRWQGEPTTENLYQVTEADLQPGGDYEALGNECGFGRPLTLTEVLDMPDADRPHASAWKVLNGLEEAMGRWLGGACDRAGITDKAARLRLQEDLQALFASVNQSAAAGEQTPA